MQLSNAMKKALNLLKNSKYGFENLNRNTGDALVRRGLATCKTQRFSITTRASYGWRTVHVFDVVYSIA